MTRNNIISLADLKRLSHKEVNDIVSRRMFEHWPKYRVNYYKELLVSYAKDKLTSPQRLYDLIMQPEIDARIREHQARYGIKLSRVEARPNPGDNGRDLIRKWLYQPTGTVAIGFLRYVRRFIIKEYRDFLSYRDSSATIIEDRREYHCSALFDISQTNLSNSHSSKLFKVDKNYTFIAKPLKSIFGSVGMKIFSVSFHKSGIGSFNIFSISKSPMNSLDHAADLDNKINIDQSDISLEVQGYLWAPESIDERLDHSKTELNLETVFARNFVKSQSMPPCKPTLISNDLEILINYKEVFGAGNNQKPSLGTGVPDLVYISGGKLSFPTISFPEMYEIVPVEVNVETQGIIKKLEGIQINV